MDYIKKFNRMPVFDDNLVYFLGDRFEFSKTWSAVSGRVPCYRRNTGKYLFRKPMKFLTSTDKLASLGWPVTAEVAAEMGTTVLPTLDILRADLLAGNSMRLSNATIILLTGLACFGKRC